MDDRELSKLKRVELLERLVALSEENDKLRNEKNELEEKLQDRRIAYRETGNLAEAALKISGIFEAADNAAELYLENIHKGSLRAAVPLTEDSELDS